MQKQTKQLFLLAILILVIALLYFANVTAAKLSGDYLSWYQLISSFTKYYILFLAILYLLFAIPLMLTVTKHPTFVARAENIHIRRNILPLRLRLATLYALALVFKNFSKKALGISLTEVEPIPKPREKFFAWVVVLTLCIGMVTLLLLQLSPLLFYYIL